MKDLNVALQALAVRLTWERSRARQHETVSTAASRPGTSVGDDDRGETSPDLIQLLAMPLNLFARHHQYLEVRVAWHPETLWFVPDERDTAVLGREGVGRGRVWTAGELTQLMLLSDRTLTAIATVALAKCAIDGDIVDVRRR